MGNEIFTQRLNEAMATAHIKGSELANLVGTSQANITCYRKGKYAPKLRMIKKMAEVLHVNPAWLAGIVSDSTPVKLTGKDLAHNQIEVYIADMSEEQTKKVLKFIEEFVI